MEEGLMMRPSAQFQGRKESIYEDSVDGNGDATKLGTLMGVYVPCMLSIFGAIIFIRLGWAVGQAGIWATLGIFFVAGLTVTLTALSISAISTNGAMKGGGAYFMISRSLGPEFGASVGLIFYLANAIAATFHLAAFAENFCDNFECTPSGLMGKVVVSSIALFILLLACLPGAAVFSKLNVYIYVVMVFAIVSMILSLSFSSLARDADGHTGLHSGTFSDNMGESYTGKYSYWKVFAVVFPSCTGIMAGANLSGDLKDPGKSIGPGTLSAIACSLVTYCTAAIIYAASVERDVLQDNYQIAQETCYSEYVLIIGIWASTLSSALSSLIGGARVLQAIARDDLIGFLSWFKVGWGPTDEPVRPLLLTWLIAQLCMFVGDFNSIAGIITNFFLLTYAGTNFACFVLKVSGAPNFRPLFKYFTWHTALAGSLLSLVVMFLCDVIYASVSVMLMIGCFVWILYISPPTPWGDVSQALIFHQVRKYLLRLDSRKEHPKFWRPSLLFLPRVIGPSMMPLVDFCNDLKKGGLYVIGDVVLGEPSEYASIIPDTHEYWLELINGLRVKGFAEVTVSPRWVDGALALIFTGGLGGMKPNSVCIPLDADDPVNPIRVRARRRGKGSINYQRAFTALHRLCERRAHPHVPLSPMDDSASDTQSLLSDSSSVLSSVLNDDNTFHASLKLHSHLPEPGRITLQENKAVRPLQDTEELFQVMAVSLQLRKNLLITRNFHKLSMAELTSYHTTQLRRMTVDVWLDLSTDDAVEQLLSVQADQVNIDSTVSLQLQLAHVLHRCDVWEEHTSLRAVCVVSEDQSSEQVREAVQQVLRTIRVIAEIFIVTPLTGGGLTADLIRLHNHSTAVAFVGMPSKHFDVARRSDRSPDATHSQQLMTKIVAFTETQCPVVLCVPGSQASIVTTAL